MTTNKDALDEFNDAIYWADEHHMNDGTQIVCDIKLSVPLVNIIRHALQTQAELVECLKWYIETDETNEGDASEHGGENWDKVNAYYIAGKSRAKQAITKAEQGSE